MLTRVPFVRGPQCLAVVPITYNSRSTPENSAGGAFEVLFLNRHTLDCSPCAMQRFQLQSGASDPNLVRYDYQCTCSPYISSTVAMYYTAWDEAAIYPANGWQSYYLDRHGVYCPLGSAMVKFWLESNANVDKMRYAFGCAVVSNMDSSSCRYRTTAPDADGSGDIRYLDRHNSHCGANEFLRGFKYYRPTQTTISYEVFCCPAQNQPSSIRGNGMVSVWKSASAPSSTSSSSELI